MTYYNIQLTNKSGEVFFWSTSYDWTKDQNNAYEFSSDVVASEVRKHVHKNGFHGSVVRSKNNDLRNSFSSFLGGLTEKEIMTICFGCYTGVYDKLSKNSLRDPEHENLYVLKEKIRVFLEMENILS